MESAQPNNVFSGSNLELSPLLSLESSGSSTSGYSWSTWVIIIILIVLLLAILGLNIFWYLAKGTQSFADVFGPYLRMFGFEIGNTTKQTVNVAALGTQTVANVTAGTVSNAVDVLQQPIDIQPNQTTSLTQTLNGVPPPQHPETEDYVADQARSSTGFCYIGDDNGNRTCMQVNSTDKCMSGNIFPSAEVCINPNLRV